MVESLNDPHFNKIQNIKHAFFTRSGGVSGGIYATLNCGYKNQDDRQNIRENRSRAMAHLGYPLTALMTTINTHSADVAIIEQPWLESQRPQADAMVTTLSNIVLGTDSADCPIVLFADDKARVIGLAHAGWRGAKKGIIAATVKAMLKQGANIHNITAVIGPCIAQDSYEVSLDFYQDFLQDNIQNKQYFIPALKAEHFMFDLRAYVISQLQQAEVESIHWLDIDTYRDERFFSCRRARHHGESDFGGHFSAIAMI